MTKPVGCPYCNQEKPSLDSLRRHVMGHKVGKLSLSESGQSVLRCHFCNQEERNDVDMKTHVAKHSGKYNCLVCPFVTKDTTSLRYHMRSHVSTTMLKDVWEVSFILEMLSQIKNNRRIG